ncbi:MAG TPA: dTDP-4-dehydrorhamnose 3,5-epimerase [Ignavibacteriaceae bacterium]|nr:dTDP-4-dehydrorhamnose 3,5-epimerase [Ignavibacteriaceae bacterium]
MKVVKTALEGLLVIHPDIYKDDRGYFYELYNKNTFKNNGLTLEFDQDNISKSKKGTIRGLHYQRGSAAQVKLCKTIKGNVLDVAVDLRKNSPTFAKYFMIELSEDNQIQLFIPKGFAHGFVVLSYEAIFHYKCSGIYKKDEERSIFYNDPELCIKWPIDNPIVSPKDKKAPLLKDVPDEDLF